MTSQRSTNNYTVSFGKILAQALRRGNWMIALSVLASFVAGPVCFLFVLQQYESYLETDYGLARAETLLTAKAHELASSLADYFTGTYAWLQLIVVLVGAVIVSVFGFRHLYHRRSADLYGSMPVTRGRQFLAQYLAGFLIWFVPFAVGNAAILLIAAFRVDGYFTVYAAELLRISGRMILHFLIVYNGCLVAVQLSGNTVNALMNSVLYGILTFSVYGIFYLYCEKYLETFVSSDRLAQLFAGLAPMAAPVALTSFLSEAAPGEYLTLLVSSGIMMPVNFVLAKRLHDLRPSETAEHGLECRPVRLLLRAVVSVCAGLLLGLFFGAITTSDLEEGWSVFGCVFGTVLVFAILNVIYHASFRELLSHKLQLAGCALLSVVILLGFRMDVFGYDAYVADESDITGLAININSLWDDGYVYIWDDAGQRYTYCYEDTPTATVSTDASEIYKTLVTLTDDSRDKDTSNSWEMNVLVFTKAGTYSRTYRIYRSDMDTVAPLLDTDAYRDTYYPGSMGSLATPEEIDIQSFHGSYVELTDAEKITQLYTAYQEDFQEHYCTDLILSESEMSDYVRLNFTRAGYSPSLTVYPCFTRTLSLLREWFPGYAWSLEDLEITGLDIWFTVTADNCEESVEQMLETLGVDDATREALDDLITEAKSLTNGWSDYWCSDSTEEQITDPEILAALTPYLSMSSYSEDAEMVRLGYATVSFAGGSANQLYTEDSLRVYVEKGKVPAKVIELILKYYIAENDG